MFRLSGWAVAIALLGCNAIGKGDTDPGTDESAGEETGDSETGETGETGDDTAAPVDGDGDGYALGDDCDDDDGEVHPGAEERCDDVDSDCDGFTDDAEAADASTWYADADGDGYGDPSATTRACDAPAGAVASAGDCADADASTYPGAAEICDDGVVNDCDGDAASAQDACGFTGEIDLSASAARLIGEDVDDRSGRAVSGVGDVDGDGRDDLLVGAERQSAGGRQAGAAYLVLGPVTGDLDLSGADARLIGEEVGDGAGTTLSAGGDVDGDGMPDLLVGAPYQDSGGSTAGLVYVVPGTTRGDLNLSDAAARLIGESDDDYAGAAVSSAGDVDGDGLDDLLIGAPYQEALKSSSGAAYLVLSPVSGDLDLSMADAKLRGRIEDHNAGHAVATAGDTDGDGLTELLIGAYESSGTVYLVPGSTRGNFDLQDATATLTGENSSDHAGISLSTAGDADGDGLDDLLLGSDNQSAGASFGGAAYLVLSPVSSDLNLAYADAKLLGEDSMDYAGAVCTAGDVDGDGLPDVLVGASYQDAGGADAGAAYVVLAPMSGVLDLSSASAKLVGEEAGDGAGISISGAGDVNGDGLDDVFVGAWRNDAGGIDAGVAYLIASPTY